MVIFGHKPFVIDSDAPIIVFGDGFPLDPADINLLFLTPDGDEIPISQITRFDEDGEGNGELIEGVASVLSTKGKGGIEQALPAVESSLVEEAMTLIVFAPGRRIVVNPLAVNPPAAIS